MNALAGQISELDGVVICGRVVGVRGLMVEVAGPLHPMSVGARVVIEAAGQAYSLRGRGIFWWQRAAHALRATRRCAARTPCGGHHGCRRGSPLGRLGWGAWSRARRAD